MSSLDWANLNDEELVSEAQNGSHPAFAELMRRHRKNAMTLALSILHDRQDAEDEVQNGFWKAFQYINQFQRDARFSTWLTRIMVNQCLMRLRRERRAKFLYIDDMQIGEEIGTLELPAREQTPEQEFAAKELSGVVEREVLRIPPLLRTVFMLRDVQRLPMPEVADKLGISVPAAKSRLLRARSELKCRLEKYEGRLGLATLLAA